MAACATLLTGVPSLLLVLSILFYQTVYNFISRVDLPLRKGYP